ncbi:actin-binding protein IPP-like [Dendronephthya gigantea]|uniref:actin-binding protein IPP-like n=1 Tax=Dendronephthya gigantea TaxID=151771 RepID=UPI001069E325|nr:actin-binding protein IPP-like [Dendronephthya gigantea]
MARRSSFGGYDEERFVNKVDDRLLCPICFKVVKDPVRCPNEHHFCRSCIQKCLNETSETCPTCQHHLTEETLAKPTRFFMETLERLKIRCDHASRGCRELVELEFLDRHVEKCGYSPTRCTNTGCSEVVNRNEQEQHENELCCFRIIVCYECGENVIWKSKRVHPCFIRKETDDLVNNLKEFRLAQDEFNCKLLADVARQNVVIDDLRRRNEEMKSIAKEATDWFTGRRKIYVCGGRLDRCNLRSVESFSWPENAWTLEPAMNVRRSAPASFVYQGQINVSGGCFEGDDTDVIERLDVGKDKKKWTESLVKMPIKCSAHGMVSHKNTAILTGGCVGENIVSDGIYEIELTPPYTTKLLTQLPERRCLHGCQIIDNEVVVVGGQTSTYHKDATATVYAYDINNNECKTLPPLPFPIAAMATVSYEGNVVLIGGANKHVDALNTVFMYEVKTGKCKELPRLNQERAGCTAVITGNMIIVMGGCCETNNCLNSVECLDLSTNEWRELSPMKRGRCYAAASLHSLH